MICHNCGATVPDDSFFCENCGTRLEPIEDTELVPTEDKDVEPEEEPAENMDQEPTEETEVEIEEDLETLTTQESGETELDGSAEDADDVEVFSVEEIEEFEESEEIEEIEDEDEEEFEEFEPEDEEDEEVIFEEPEPEDEDEDEEVIFEEPKPEDEDEELENDEIEEAEGPTLNLEDQMIGETGQPDEAGDDWFKSFDDLAPKEEDWQENGEFEEKIGEEFETEPAKVDLKSDNNSGVETDEEVEEFETDEEVEPEADVKVDELDDTEADEEAEQPITYSDEPKIELLSDKMSDGIAKGLAWLGSLGKNVHTGTGWAADKAKEKIAAMKKDAEEVSDEVEEPLEETIVESEEIIVESETIDEVKEIGESEIETEDREEAEELDEVDDVDEAEEGDKPEDIEEPDEDTEPEAEKVDDETEAEEPDAADDVEEPEEGDKPEDIEEPDEDAEPETEEPEDADEPEDIEEPGEGDKPEAEVADTSSDKIKTVGAPKHVRKHGKSSVERNSWSEEEMGELNLSSDFWYSSRKEKPEGTTTSYRTGSNSGMDADDMTTKVVPLKKVGPNDVKRAQRKKMSGKKLKIFVIIAAIAVLVGAGGVFGSKVHKENEVEAKYQADLVQAGKYVEAKDYKNAETIYTDLLKIYPDRAELYENLTRLYITEERFDEAKNILNEGIAKTGKSETYTALAEDIKALTSTEWREPFRRVLANNEWAVRRYEDENDVAVALCDVTGDRKPELFFLTQEYFGYGKLHIYTYVDNKAKEITYDIKNRSTDEDDAFYDVERDESSYVVYKSKKDGQFGIYESFLHGGVDAWQTTHEYTLKGTDCHKDNVIEACITTDYRMSDDDDEDDNTEYYKNGDKVKYKAYIADFQRILNDIDQVIITSADSSGDKEIWSRIMGIKDNSMTYDGAMKILDEDAN